MKDEKVRVISRLGLLGIQRDERREYGGVDCNLIVDQSSDDLLDKVDRFGGKLGIRIVGFGVLDAGTKDRAVPGMRGILVAGRSKVFKFVHGFRNLVSHGYITVAVSVIPGEGGSAEEVGGPID